MVGFISFLRTIKVGHEWRLLGLVDSKTRSQAPSWINFGKNKIKYYKLNF
jgi:hypothetical protein